MAESNQKMAGRDHCETPPVTRTYLRWSSAPATGRRLLPWLLLPQLDKHHGQTNRLTFVDVLTGKRQYLDLQEPLTSWRCRGSSHGWLTILDESRNVVVLSPQTGEECSLPPLSTLPPVIHFDGKMYKLDPKYVEFDDSTLSFKEMRDLFIEKIILSDCPRRNPDFTALAIFRRNGKGTGNLAYCKSGQTTWTLIPGTSVEDAVFFEGKLYAVSWSGSMFSCDVNRDSPEVVKMEIGRPVHAGGDTSCYYLVSACDELFLVSRFFDDKLALKGDYDTVDFEVFKLCSSESGKTWERVEDLGDLALFVGANSCSSALKASEFPGCRSNLIYYTDADQPYLECISVLPRFHDLGGFLLDEKCFGTMYFEFEEPSDSSSSLLGKEAYVLFNYRSRRSRANPTWFTPNHAGV